MTTMATTVPAEAVVMIDQLIDQTLQRAEQIMRQLPVRLRPTQPPSPSEQPVPAPRFSLRNRQETTMPVASSNKTPIPARASQSASSVSSRHAGTRSKSSISSSSDSRKTRQRNVDTRRVRERKSVESKTKASSSPPDARTPPMSNRSNERVVRKADESTLINETLYLDGSGPLSPVVGATKQTARPAGQHPPPIITDENPYGPSDNKRWQIRRQIAIAPSTKGEQSLDSQRVYPVQHAVATVRPEKPACVVPLQSASSSASATTTVTMNDIERDKTTGSTETDVSPHALVVRGLEGADGLAFELSLIVKNTKTGRDRHIRIKADCPQFVPKNVWIDGRQIQ